MVKASLLYLRADDPRRDVAPAMPACFVDLNLDQAVDAIARSRPDYALSGAYYTALASVDEILYRQEVFGDLESCGLVEPFRAFSGRMQSTRRGLSSLEKIHSNHHREGWFLEAALDYCEAIRNVESLLDKATLSSRALKAFRRFFEEYLRSEAFSAFAAEAAAIKGDLAGIEYSVTIKDLNVRVSRYEGEPDYSEDIGNTFRRFRQGTVKDYLSKYPESAGLDHVQGQILDCVARLYPEIFARLDRFCQAHASFLDETVDAFDRELQFYLAWIEYIAPLRQAGLRLSCPEVSAEDKNLVAEGAFDIALAKKLVLATSPIVTNDVSIQGPERIIVVTGPNQGGKTTFARVLGQLHYLALIGVPVPASRARLFLCDAIYTHFEREETVKTHRGKLHEEIIGLHESLERATPRSLLVLNEVFTSTTLNDSLFLSRRILGMIADLGALCVCVTFLDELAAMGDKVASYVSQVNAQDPSIRTFKVERKPADGLAYARSLAEKHCLTYECLKERIPT